MAKLIIEPGYVPKFSPEAKVHPEIERAFRQVALAAYDGQQAAIQLAQQVEGGAMGTLAMTGDAVTSGLVTAPGYYLKAPTAVVQGDGTGAMLTVNTRSRVVNGVTVFRVTGVTVISQGSGYTTANVVFSS